MEAMSWDLEVLGGAWGTLGGMMLRSPKSFLLCLSLKVVLQCVQIHYK